MKKIVFSVVSAFALASFAADSTEFGVLKVPCTSLQTIVSVPWLESATSTTDISVSNLVLTAGLPNETTLNLYNGGTPVKGWYLMNGTWYPGSEKSGSDQTTIPRGSALILTCPSLPTSGCIYLMGKPATGKGHIDLAQNAYTLVAPTNVDGPTSISELAWTGLGGKANDYLYVFEGATLKTYRYIKDGWYNMSAYPTIEKGGSIPAGTGAWFYTKGTGRSVDL